MEVTKALSMKFVLVTQTALFVMLYHLKKLPLGHGKAVFSSLAYVMCLQLSEFLKYLASIKLITGGENPELFYRKNYSAILCGA